MPPAKRIILWILVAVPLLGLLWVFRPYQVPDNELVHPDSVDLLEPYAEVRFFYWKDGGSVGMRVMDAKGKIFMACCPRPFMEDERKYYQTVYLGAVHHSFKGAFELKGHPHTKLVVAKILRERDDPHLYSDLTAAQLSGRWRDYARALWRRYTRGHDYVFYGNDESFF